MFVEALTLKDEAIVDLRLHLARLLRGPLVLCERLVGNCVLLQEHRLVHVLIQVHSLVALVEPRWPLDGLQLLLRAA